MSGLTPTYADDVRLILGKRLQELEEESASIKDTLATLPPLPVEDLSLSPDPVKGPKHPKRGRRSLHLSDVHKLKISRSVRKHRRLKAKALAATTPASVPTVHGPVAVTAAE